ncbi:hypothetical protein [Candidatus Chromulinivorax destructor]|uniref:Uncharacterized protein n=1 Tax=Candidatus Chromulinivorax destructor TaxID=2066483 RepID=A0A345ZA35_9BACT|nr:hypothetical protein [Candidatus Chromulinivorax destructor]AXK60152.1 hypothetical protein C0J27_00100 [Candidatus Chromulinivorax destructor]
MHEKIIQFITNLIFMVTILSVCVIKISCSDNFLADLNQGTSVIYWSENNGDGNEEEFLRELRAFDTTLQKKLRTPCHHHKIIVENDSFPEESDQSDRELIRHDANTRAIENNTSKICCCAIS